MTREEAIKVLSSYDVSRLYKDVKHEEVDAVRFNHFGVAILTDY